MFLKLLGIHGTTSACAENTSVQAEYAIDTWNYLRVRGEYQRLNDTNLYLRELPPRARRILPSKDSIVKPAGTTSACAENT